MYTYDVIIVGAGPVGLATAIGLRQRGIDNILVLDQTRAFRKIGQAVDILPNGLKALKYLDRQAYEEVKKSSLNVTQPNNSSTASRKWFVRDLQGQPIRSFPLSYDEWLKNYGEGRLNITWFDLQTTLRKLLPSELVKPNHRCINIVYEQENESVRVDCLSDMTVEANPYAHWNEQENTTQTQPQNINNNINNNFEKSASKSFRGKLVIAADGINSTLRKVLYKNTEYETFACPEYSGYVAIIGSGIFNLAKKFETEIQEKFLQNSPIVTITKDGKLRDSACEQPPRMILINRQPGQYQYISFIPVTLKQLQEESPINLTLQQLEKHNFPNCIKELVRLSNPANMQHRIFYIHPAIVSNSLPFPTTANRTAEDNSVKIQPPWHIGRVVLVGDAAHGMPPFAAQGANQGLEDALTIATLISKLGMSDKFNNINAIQAAFEKYENQRRPLMDYVQKVTMTGVNYLCNQEELDKYNQQIFARNFEQLLETLT